MNFMKNTSLLTNHYTALKQLHPNVYNDITRALDKDKGAVFVMVDLSSAFKTIDQNQLLDLTMDVCSQRQGTLVVQNLPEKPYTASPN